MSPRWDAKRGFSSTAYHREMVINIFAKKVLDKAARSLYILIWVTQGLTECRFPCGCNGTILWGDIAS